MLSEQSKRACREALGKCDQFTSHTSLVTFFALSELSSFAGNLPQVDNVTDRVERTMRYLLGLETHEGQLIFMIFLRELRNKVNDFLDLHQELLDCYQLVEYDHFSFQAKQFCEKTHFVMLDESSYSREDVVELMQHLFRCSHMRDDIERKKVLSKSELPFTQHLSAPSSDFEEVFHIFETCFLYSDGIGQLAYALCQFEIESSEWLALDRFIRDHDHVHVTYARLRQLQEIEMSWPKPILKKAYSASMPEGWDKLDITDIDESHADDLLLLMAADLAKAKQKHKRNFPILEFVEHLALYAKQQHENVVQEKLREWTNRRANELNISDVQLRMMRLKVQNYVIPSASYLLFVIEDTEYVDNKDEQKAFNIQAWPLDSDDEPITPTSIKVDEHPVAQDLIPASLNRILEQCADYLSDNTLIELLLPDELLCCAVDHWLIENGSGLQKLGIEYKVVVRSLRRAQLARKMRGTPWSRWNGKWTSFQQFLRGQQTPTEREPLWICEKGDCVAGLYSQLLENAIACLALAFVPLLLDDHSIFDAVNAGICIALWPRQKTAYSSAFSALFKSLLLPPDPSQLPQNLLNLPQLVRKQRLDAARDEHHYGHHLTLLFDLPKLPPGFTQLAGP